MTAKAAVAAGEIPLTSPQRAGIVLTTLIVASAVANLPLAMANVALPSIGAYFDASQTKINLVAVGYSLGLACSVLWLGALGDRYGHKLLLLTGVVLAIPAALIAGFAPSINILIGARIFGGITAGMAFPTCLALIAALWTGLVRTKSIALWTATGGAINACGPLISGTLLLFVPGNAIFLAVIPVAIIALIIALKFIPAHVKESQEPVDNFGGILSMLLVGCLIMAFNFAAVPNMRTMFLGLAAVAAVTLIHFVIRQRRVRNPLSGTADLQRNLSGALTQSIFGALFAAGLAAAMDTAITNSPESAQVTASVTSQLEMSYASAETIADQISAEGAGRDPCAGCGGHGGTGAQSQGGAASRRACSTNQDRATGRPKLRSPVCNENDLIAIVGRSGSCATNDGWREWRLTWHSPRSIHS